MGLSSISRTEMEWSAIVYGLLRYELSRGSARRKAERGRPRSAVYCTRFSPLSAATRYASAMVG